MNVTRALFATCLLASLSSLAGCSHTATTDEELVSESAIEHRSEGPLERRESVAIELLSTSRTSVPVSWILPHPCHAAIVLATPAPEAQVEILFEHVDVSLWDGGSLRGGGLSRHYDAATATIVFEVTISGWPFIGDVVFESEHGQTSLADAFRIGLGLHSNSPIGVLTTICI